MPPRGIVIVNMMRLMARLYLNRHGYCLYRLTVKSLSWPQEMFIPLVVSLS
jgi:hypothetical protein